MSAISLLAIPVSWAMAQWRLGLLLCLATGILQDPLRKISPDKPVFFVGFVGVVFGGACLGALARGVSLRPNLIFKKYRLVTPFLLLQVLIVIQAFNSYLRFQNLWLPLIGLLTYSLPFPSIVFAYQLAVRRREACISQFMKWYIVFIALALPTVYLEYSGYRWPILGAVGPNFIIFDHITGEALLSYSGLFRSPEIAAWHAMTAACFVVLMTLLRRITPARVMIGATAVTLLMGLGVLTGRRKIGVEFAVFASMYFALWIIFKKDIGKLAVTALAGVSLVGYGLLAGTLRDRVSDAYDRGMLDYSSYVQHTENAFQQIPTRFVELGIAPVMWAYDSFGLFGAGLGVGTQGTQYFGGGGAIAGAAEGGLGKITLELGVPGVFLMSWIAVSMLRLLWRIMRVASEHSQRMGRLSIGLFSFLVANLAGFSVATQAFGDLCVLLVLSWTLGFLLALPALTKRQANVRKQVIFEQRAPLFQPEAVSAHVS